LKQLEQDVAQGEAELEARRAVLRDDPGGDWAKLARLAKEEQELSRQVDAMMSEWMSLSEELAGASPEAAS
jgi:ATP-binding cassette subfamily F protein 3